MAAGSGGVGVKADWRFKLALGLMAGWRAANGDGEEVNADGIEPGESVSRF
jgi:hypothetical protein